VTSFDCSKFAHHEGLDKRFEHRRDLLLVVLGFLGPSELGLVDVTVTVTDGRADHLVREANDFDKRDHLRAEFHSQTVHGISEVLVGTLTDVPSTVEDASVLVQGFESVELAEVVEPVSVLGVRELSLGNDRSENSDSQTVEMGNHHG